MAQSPAFGPTIWSELAAAGVPDGVVQMFVPLDVLSPDGGLLYPAGTVIYTAGATADQRAAVAKVVAAHDPTQAPPRPAPYLTGRDVVDGLSPAQAKVADAADPRNLARVAGADRASEVKSCIRRIADANGVTPAALLAQATATGGP